MNSHQKYSSTVPQTTACKTRIKQNNFSLNIILILIKVALIAVQLYWTE